MKILRNLIKNVAGTTSIEYGLIAVLISVAAISAYGNTAEEVNDTFTDVNVVVTEALD